jgi:hypothetical protein
MKVADEKNQAGVRPKHAPQEMRGIKPKVLRPADPYKEASILQKPPAKRAFGGFTRQLALSCRKSAAFTGANHMYAVETK